MIDFWDYLFCLFLISFIVCVIIKVVLHKEKPVDKHICDGCGQWCSELRLGLCDYCGAKFK